MSSVELPSHLQHNKVAGELKFSVQTLTATTATFDTLTERYPQLVLGTKVSFLDGELGLVKKGFISMVRSNSVVCTFFQELTPQEFSRIVWVILSDRWNAVVRPNQLIDATIFVAAANQFAVLDAICQVPTEHVAGLVSWSLFYATQNQEDLTSEVLKGTDYSTVGSCYWRQAGLWKAGVYTLIAQRLDPVQGNIVSQDSKTWTLSQPSRELSCGQYYNHLPALRLL